MVTLKDWKSYRKSMKADRQDFLNFKQYKYVHSGTSEGRANMPQNIRTKILRSLG